MTLLYPVWLFLLIPLGLALWRWPMPSRLLGVLRGLALLLALLALCGLTLRLPSRAGTVVVLADRSLSMPRDSNEVQKGVIDLLEHQMGADDLLGVVSFGRNAEIEHRPGSSTRFGGFVYEIVGDGSNLAEALEKALSLIPRDAPGKVLVLSDGRWTGSDPAAAAARAAARGVAIDYRPLERSVANDLAISRVDAPPSVAPGEAFLLTAWVHSPVPQTAEVTLKRGDMVLASGKQVLQGGLNRLTFRDRAGADGGTFSYRLEVQGSGDDPVPENNSARLLVGVAGPRPVLHVSTAKESGLAKLLAAGKLDVRVKSPEECRWTLEHLSKYSCVLMENVSADKIGTTGMETLAAWVRETGAGLMMTGGQRSYGPGGYYKSPLEPIMPVTMELKNEHRKLSVAIVVTLDRSGSMAIPVGGGRAKMDLANDGTAKVLEVLGPMDEFGCIAVDTIPHEIVPLSGATDKEPKTDKIKRIQSMGGGIFIYVALKAAAEMIQPAKAATRHIILFADANDSEEPGDYVTLVSKCRDAGITISVIGLGTEHDKDAELLKDIAKRGGGRVFSDKPEDLPLLFAQDTFVVARNTFLDEPVKVTATPQLTAMTGRPFEMTRSIGGYNLTYLRDEARLGVFTEDEYKAPVVAAWQAGTGRVLCYTGEADGKYAGAIAGWPDVGNFFTSLVRWTAGQSGNLPNNMLVTQEVRNGVGLIQLHLDPERRGEAFTALPAVSVLTAREGMQPAIQKRTLRWTGADTLAVEVPLVGIETVLATVEVPGQKPVSLPPLCLPYSPEFQPPEADRGLPALQRLARATGGQERLAPSEIWKDLPRHARLIPVAPWLLAAVVVLLLLEVLERRTGFLSRQGHLIWEVARVPAERARKLVVRKPRPAAIPQASPPAVVPQPRPETPQAAVVLPPAPALPVRQEDGMVEALRKARQRTRRRGDS